MLVHLSTTSPYVCDISLGPIEQANRMASAPTTKSYLEVKESFPKLQQVRTPLKLLAPDEVPIDTSLATTTTTDINTSRQQSLQPVWYTEQSIVDDNNEQQRNSIKSPNHRLDLTRSTLPPIESHSPEIEDEIIEKEFLANKSSLMRKSSTFTIEPQPSINIPSTLNESEKENDLNIIITSTQEEPARHPAEPSDESFRALEHLLGLGSTTANLTMTTTAQESPKSNHESLSLTIVTPTELINQTTASLHLSYAPAGGGSLPSSQNILLMPTIESITDPSMNSTIPPPFLVDNSDLEEPSSAGGTVINQNENSNLTDDDSFHFTDEDEEKQETPKDDTNTEDESNFSFELNDFPNNSKDTTHESAPPPPMITVRAPTSADVAYRALIKSRLGGRISQPNKTESPLAKTNKIKLTERSSVPIPSRVLRSSSHPISTDPIVQEELTEIHSIPNDECFVNENKTDDDYPRIELVEVVSLPEEDEIEEQQNGEITLNLTGSKDIHIISPNSAEEADRSASSSSSYESPEQNVATPTDPKMPVLSLEYTYNTPTARPTRSSERRRSIITNRQSYSRSIHSFIPPIIEQQTTITEEEKDLSSDSNSICSIPSSSSKPMLTKLSTNRTVISEAPSICLQKSLADSASPSPNPTPIITIRPSERLSSNLSPRRNINPLHSSTPSIRNKSLQMIFIGEEEQLTTTVPQQFQIDDFTNEMIDNEQQVDIPIQIHSIIDQGIQTSPERPSRHIDIGVQTTPSLDPSSRRCFQTIEQQTSPMIPPRSTSCQTIPIIEEQYQQITPLHTKSIAHLRRNVRFQFTPSTDARLTAKEKLEEEQKGSKQEIPIKQILSDNEREEDTEDESLKVKKKITTSKKIKIIKNDENSSEETNESPIRRTTRNRSKKTNDTDVSSTTTHSNKKTSKRAARNEKKVIPIPEPEIIVTTTSPPRLPTKRANRKRPNPKASTIPPPETTSPTEPVIKRAKTTKTIEVKPPVPVPSPEPPSTRNRSKPPVIPNNTIKLASSSESTEKPPIPKKAKKTSSETNSTENPSIPTNNKRKNPTSTIKKGKRRLHSVEHDEGLNTADEEETIQIIIPPIEIPPLDLSQEEREKIEGLTVAELKNRLTTHDENIPKGARKADLIALLVKIETNLLKERKETEQAVITVDVPANSTSRKTRRKK